MSVPVSANGRDGHISAITVDAKGVPADETMVLAFESMGSGIFGTAGIVEGPVPSCVRMAAPPIVPGSGGGSSSGHASGGGGRGIFVVRRLTGLPVDRFADRGGSQARDRILSRF